MPTAPTLRFLLASPAHFIALGCGSGLPRVAPGTFGTLFGWLVFALVDHALGGAGLRAWLAACAACFVIGAWAAQRTGTALGVADSGHIVVDEIVAIWIVLASLPPGASWLLQAGAFGAFRAFDIVKPPPIRTLDERLKNGWGVMVDDLVAALYAIVALGVILHLTGAAGAIAIK
ncbi:MAG TPA: phosphatidylglycerophosphatase A [Burkholderiaceae bacterium]|nr:phosphatidylglycerophosphatase A [Burkholderiaceae bacterium]